jgi:type IV pilus assembly protein PilC
MNFRFLASDSSGKTVSGTLHARDEAEARRELLSQSMSVRLLQSAGKRPSNCNGVLGAIRSFFTKRRMNRGWKSQFFQQMHTLLGAGITIGQALAVIADGCEKTSEEYAVFNGLLLKIRTGRSLSDAMAAFRGKFSHAEINVIRVAEYVGQPQRAMKHLCEFSKTLDAVKRKAVLAMIYPCVVLVVAAGVLSILSAVVVPQFQEIFFTQAPHELPTLTRIVLALCAFFRENIIPIIALPFAAYYGSKFLPKSWRNAIGMVRLPVVSNLIGEYNLYLFTSTLAMLLSCGVQLQESLGIARNVVFDGHLSRRLARGLERINRGETVSLALGGILSKFAIGLVVVGERTGTLDASFSEISRRYNDSLVARLAAVTAMVEPALITILAVIVGIIIIAIFLPMVEMMQGLSV